MPFSRRNFLLSAAMGGAAAAMGGDVVLVREDAQLVTAFSSLGMTPDTGVSYWLPRVLGPVRATQLLLGDSIGEMFTYFAAADIAFVGGSLVANGGHNLLEPAALGKPVLSGPHLFNFLEIAAQLREAGALNEVENAGQLADKVATLLNEPSEIQRMSQAGLSVLKANQGALQRLLEGLQRLL